MNQDYLAINQNNFVDNIITWDGNSQTWKPPVGYTMVIKETTPALIWQPIVVDNVVTDYVLTEEIGVADIGFTWDGTVCTTNKPKPVTPVPK